MVFFIIWASQLCTLNVSLFMIKAINQLLNEQRIKKYGKHSNVRTAIRGAYESDPVFER